MSGVSPVATYAYNVYYVKSLLRRLTEGKTPIAA